MAKFKNVGDACHMYRPAGHSESLLVDKDQVVDVFGEVSSEIEDAYIVGEGDRALAFPKSRWLLVTDPPKPRRDAEKEN